MAHVEDRWVKNKTRTGRHGQGMRYRVRWTGPDGREQSKSYPDGRKKEAQAWGDDQEAAIRRGTWVDPNAGRTVLAQFAETVWLPAQRSNPTTQERLEYQWRLHIKPTLGKHQLGYLAAHPSVIQQWVKNLPMAASSAKIVLDALSGILTMALDDGYINRNPVRGKSVQPPVQDKRRIIPWTTEQVAGVRGALPGRFQGLVDCGSGLGLRQGEAIAYSPDDIEWIPRVAHVRRQIKFIRRRMCFAMPKGDRERDVMMPERTGRSLARHIELFPAVPVTLPWADDAFLRSLDNPGDKEAAAKVNMVTVRLFFTTVHGKGIRRSDFDSHTWVPATEAAGMARDRRNGFHALRHHFASWLLAEGLDIRTLSEWLGHSDPGFTLRTYAHLMPGAEGKARRIIDAPREVSADGPDTAQGSGR